MILANQIFVAIFSLVTSPPKVYASFTPKWSSPIIVEESKLPSMTNSFVEHFKISHICVYYNDTTWDRLSRSILKIGSKRYVQLINNQSISVKSSALKHSITLHLFLDQNIVRLNEIIQEHNQLQSENMNIETVGLQQKEYFLIRVPNGATMNEIKELFESTPLKYDSLAFCFKMIQDNNSIVIYDVYKIGLENEVKIRQFGEFVDGRFTVAMSKMWERRSDMEGYHLKAAAVLNPPYIDHLEDNCTSSKCFKGTYSRIWNNLQNKMNFTFSIKKETVWGTKIKGTWYGLIGMCERKEVDIVPADLGVTRERSSVVDFLPGITPTYQQIFIQNPA